MASNVLRSLPEILVKAFDDLLDKRYPLRKDQRAAARKENAVPPSPGKEAGGLEARNRPSLGKEAGSLHPAVPAAIRHGVWLRDGGRCTWQFPDGARCNERTSGDRSKSGKCQKSVTADSRRSLVQETVGWRNGVKSPTIFLD